MKKQLILFMAKMEEIKNIWHLVNAKILSKLLNLRFNIIWKSSPHKLWAVLMMVFLSRWKLLLKVLRNGHRNWEDSLRKDIMSISNSSEPPKKNLIAYIFIGFPWWLRTPVWWMRKGLMLLKSMSTSRKSNSRLLRKYVNFINKLIRFLKKMNKVLLNWTKRHKSFSNNLWKEEVVLMMRVVPVAIVQIPVQDLTVIDKQRKISIKNCFCWYIIFMKLSSSFFSVLNLSFCLNKAYYYFQTL